MKYKITFKNGISYEFFVEAYSLDEAYRVFRKTMNNLHTQVDRIVKEAQSFEITTLDFRPPKNN